MQYSSCYGIRRSEHGFPRGSNLKLYDLGYLILFMSGLLVRYTLLFYGVRRTKAIAAFSFQ